MVKVRSRLGKYRIEKRLGQGGFADVFVATDTVEGVRVALKVPRPSLVNKDTLDLFKKEARVHAELDHPNILPMKNAELVDGHFVIAYRLGEQSLADRMRRRIATATCLEFTEQMIAALEYAHEHRVIHCDLKPENFILFAGNQLRLADFGIARVALRTIKGSGSGTLGYMSPEQAMGRASFRADVFSLGLILYELFTGHLPQWPFDWPPPAFDKLKQKVHPDFIAMLRRCLEIAPSKRFADAEQVARVFRKLKPKARRFLTDSRSRRNGPTPERNRTDWKELRFRQCQHEFGRALHLDRACRKCQGPMSEPMHKCPWCGTIPKPEREETGFPARCRRCGRGRKLDWQFCAWCFGPGFADTSTRTFPDKRYTKRCSACRGSMMPFMSYCPWCRRKPKSPWKIAGAKGRCVRCGWSVLEDYWKHCAWCGTGLHGAVRQKRRS